MGSHADSDSRHGQDILEMRFFKESEFFCCLDCALGFKDMEKKFLSLIEDARDIAGVPFKINSSIRCTDHNKKVGGSKTSSHLKGTAVDISCTKSYERFKIVEGLIAAGFYRIGIAKTFIHVDDDTSKPKELIWTY